MSDNILPGSENVSEELTLEEKLAISQKYIEDLKTQNIYLEHKIRYLEQLNILKEFIVELEAVYSDCSRFVDQNVEMFLVGLSTEDRRLANEILISLNTMLDTKKKEMGERRSKSYYLIQELKYSIGVIQENKAPYSEENFSEVTNKIKTFLGLSLMQQ